MATFHFYISRQVDVPDDVANEAGKRLKRYIDRICHAMKPVQFTGSAFTIDPHNSVLRDQDLLVYLTQESMNVRVATRKNLEVAGLSRPGGTTFAWPEGVLSEVFWTGGLMNLRDTAHKGIALANLIMHEWGHNKLSSDATAVAGGEKTGGHFLHTSCGGGVFGSALSIGVATKLDLLPDNVTAMARVFDAANKQYPFGLYSDELGF